MLTADTPPIDALIFLSSHCPFCPALVEAVMALVKAGEIRRLEVVNVALDPEAAAAHGVRSVPWLQLGPLLLEGAQNPSTLRAWIARLHSEEGLTDYFREQLASGRLALAERVLARQPALATALLPLVANTAAPMQVRVGVGALLEGLAAEAWGPLLAGLQTLTEHADHRIRADACHYLGLSRAVAVRPALVARLTDESAEVREIAQEALATIDQGA